MTCDDTVGMTDQGTWQNPADAQEGGFRVLIEGDKVLWHSKQDSDRGLLRGGVADTFLKGGE